MFCMSQLKKCKRQPFPRYVRRYSKLGKKNKPESFCVHTGSLGTIITSVTFLKCSLSSPGWLSQYHTSQPIRVQAAGLLHFNEVSKLLSAVESSSPADMCLVRAHLRPPYNVISIYIAAGTELVWMTWKHIWSARQMRVLRPCDMILMK